MAKKATSKVSILHNVYLLYALFIAALLHLGYFIFTKDTMLLVSFSLAVIFVYLVNPNMIIVLASSLVLVDMLYLVKRVPERFEGFDSSQNTTDSSGNNIRQGFENSTPLTLEPEQKPLTFANLMNKVNEIHIEDSKARKQAQLQTDGSTLDPAMNTSGTKEKVAGKSIQEVDQETKEVSSILSKVKNTNPEVAESLLQLNSIDINQLNTLINNLNEVAKTLKTNGA